MASAPRLTRPIPALQMGDHLTVREFERRYVAMPHIHKAELIDGRVYMPSPVSEWHGAPHATLHTWLGLYRGHTPGTRHGDNSSLRLDVGENEPQPDAYLRILGEYGGQSKNEEGGYIRGAPELVAEVAASSVSYDLHEKLEAYERNGVQEYLVWRVEDEAVDWFGLQRGRFRPQRLGRDGRYKSKVFPGLWLDLAALLADELLPLFAAVHDGVASPEHQRFVQRLHNQRQ